MARSAHGPRLSDRRGSEDLPGPVYLRQRRYAIRDDRRPTPRAKHYRPGRLAAHGRPRLQRGVRGLRFSTAGVWTQTHRLTRAIEIGDNEDEFTDTVALQIFDTNGNVIVKGCATSVGYRFE